MCLLFSFFFSLFFFFLLLLMVNYCVCTCCTNTNPSMWHDINMKFSISATRKVTSRLFVCAGEETRFPCYSSSNRVCDARFKQKGYLLHTTYIYIIYNPLLTLELILASKIPRYCQVSVSTSQLWFQGFKIKRHKVKTKNSNNHWSHCGVYIQVYYYENVVPKSCFYTLTATGL